MERSLKKMIYVVVGIFVLLILAVVITATSDNIRDLYHKILEFLRKTPSDQDTYQTEDSVNTTEFNVETPEIYEQVRILSGQHSSE